MVDIVHNDAFVLVMHEKTVDSHDSDDVHLVTAKASTRVVFNEVADKVKSKSAAGFDVH